MPRYIVKIDKEEAKTSQDLYMEWSTVVDAPVTGLMPLVEFREWHDWQYPPSNPGSRAAPFHERMERVRETGTSAIPSHVTPENLFLCNRAGDNETELTRKEIIEKYKNI